MTGRAAILGTGLIGASIGLGLTDRGWSVTGWDPDGEALAAAQSRGAVAATCTGIGEAVAGAELVVLAGPPRAVIDTLGDLRTGALVTDVAGIKEQVVAAARHLPHFVGGHPMAGREHAGAAAASEALFRGAAWILVEDGTEPADLARVSEIVTGLGARPVVMKAAEHDEAVAVISHLPQLLSAVLMAQAAADPQALELASGSFRDLTRVALSEPDWWAELLLANSPHVRNALRGLTELAGRWDRALDLGDSAYVTAALESARRDRRHLSPPVVAVGVVLEDRPGEIAAVGRALARSRVDVRDLQLRHGPHGGGGILTISVRPGESEGLRHALTGEGFELT